MIPLLAAPTGDLRAVAQLAAGEHQWVRRFGRHIDACDTCGAPQRDWRHHGVPRNVDEEEK